MARRRLCVALVCPPRLARGVDDLRRALGDTRMDVIGPHITLVPPVNVDTDDVAAAWAVVRAVATAARPFSLTLGPAGSFAPSTPTVHLGVAGASPTDFERLVALRGSLFDGPLARPDHRPYVPHVTLRRSVPDDEVRTGALAALTGTFGPWEVDRVALLEHVQPGAPADGVERPAGSRWFTLAEEPFGGPAVSGRGGIELALRALRALEPTVAELLGRADLAGRVVGSEPGRRLVVVAELPGASEPARAASPGSPVAVVVGTVDGATARLGGVVVAPESRGQGIGRRTALAWCSAAAERGADVVVAEADLADTGVAGGSAATADAWTALLVGCGFAMVGDLAVRRP